MSELNEHNQRIREASGEVDDQRPLVGFIYRLLRNDLPAGVLEEAVQQVLTGDGGYMFSNGWLAEYAKDVAQRLTVEETEWADHVRGVLSSNGFATIDAMLEAFQEFERTWVQGAGKPIPLTED